MEERPELFESMLGDERDVHIFRRQSAAPFIYVNPDAMTPQAMAPEPVGTALTIDSLHAGTYADGVRKRWVSALANIGDLGGVVEITAVYLMAQGSKMLSVYLLRVIGLSPWLFC